MVIISKNTTIRNNFASLRKAKFTKNYVSQFESAVKNFEQILEEEKVLKNKAVHMRLASNFQ